jgi:integrase
MPAKRPTKPRAERNQGGMYEKQGYWIDKQTGEKHNYTYWQASRDVSEIDLLPGTVRKRITGSGATKTEARKRLEENWISYHRGEPTPRTKKRARKQLTVAELYEEWQEANEAGRVSDIMFAKYRGYGKHIIAALGGIKLDDLQEAHLMSFFSSVLMNKKRPDGRPLLQSAARRNIYMALSGCFSFGISKGYLTRNPLDPVPVPVRVTPDDDIEKASENAYKILAVLKKSDSPDYCRWLFSLFGLRKGERVGLSWSNVRNLDSDRPELIISHQLARTAKKEDGGWYIKPSTKTGKKRTIVMAEPWISALREHKKRQDAMKLLPTWKPQEKFKDLVFLQSDGSIYTLNKDNLDWGKLFKENNLPTFRGHLMRHITATLLAEQKPTIPIGAVMSILGHSTQSLTLYYAKVTSEQQSSNMNTLGENLSKSLEKYM